MASGLGALSVTSGGRKYRCKHGRKARKRLFCSAVKKGGKAARRGSSSKKKASGGKRRLTGAAATAAARKFYNQPMAWGPRPGGGGVRTGSAGGPCKDKDGRSGMMNKKGRCVTPRRKR